VARIVVPALILILFNVIMGLVIHYATHLYCGGTLCPR
jgi:hypothetical protein